MEANTAERLSIADLSAGAANDEGQYVMSGTAGQALLEDELYLFETESQQRLWGVIDRVYDGVVRLESATGNLHNFEFGISLPPEYTLCRRATTFESRTYGEICGMVIGERLANNNK